MWNLVMGVLNAGAVLISGSSVCPTASDVETRLAQLLPGYVSADHVRIEQIDGALELEMHSAVHGTIFRRRLPPRRACAEQAVIAATVIAAWQMESLSTPVPPVVLPESRAPPPQVALRYEIGGALSMGVAGPDVAVGGLLDVLLLPREQQLGVRIGLFGLSPRTLPLGPGVANWTRIGLRLSGGHRFLPDAARSWSIDWLADAAAAMVYVAGQGFDQDYTSFDADFAVGSSVRLARQLGPVRPFMEIAIADWLRPQRVSAQTDQLVRTTLPQVEALFSVGVAGGGIVHKR